jgi:hypothetical protein
VNKIVPTFFTPSSSGLISMISNCSIFRLLAVPQAVFIRLTASTSVSGAPYPKKQLHVFCAVFVKPPFYSVPFHTDKFVLCIVFFCETGYNSGVGSNKPPSLLICIPTGPHRFCLLCYKPMETDPCKKDKYGISAMCPISTKRLI